MMFVDLDRFKAVNDDHGHKIGDWLLRAVAERLLLIVRDEDTVARIGGDEFGILIQGATSDLDAEVVAQRIVSAMCQPFTIDDLALSIGASVGITMLPETGDGFDSVVSRADSAMYQAKAERRGTFHTYQTANRQQLR